MLFMFFLTLVFPLVQFSLEKTLFGVREACSRFSFFGAAFSALALPEQTKTCPLVSTIYEMLIL